MRASSTAFFAVYAAVLLAAGAAPAARPAGSCRAAAFHPGPLGAVAYLRGRTLHVVELGSGRDRAIATLRARPEELSFSLDGCFVVAGDTLVPAAGGASCRASGKPKPRLPAGFSGIALDPSGKRLLAEGPHASLWVFDLVQATRRRLWRSPDPFGPIGPPAGAQWSPDGRFVLFRTDPDRSASLAADGMPLWVVPAAGGQARKIEPEVLGGDDFVQACGAHDVAVSAGFDRYVTHNKRVVLAGPPDWKPRNISRDPSRSWFAASCSPDGTSIAATVTANRPEGTFDTARRSIWLLASNGSSRRLLVGGTRPKISDEEPRWSASGRYVLYVQHPARPNPHARLYLVDVETGKRLGPFARIDGGLGYYGQHDWDALAPWYQPQG